MFESTFLGFKLANIERVSTLNRLSKTLRGHNTALYTDTIDSKLEGVDYRGAVAYMTHMPLVFNNSRINLNMTIRNIRTGIPLRVWDILGAGGFLLTNFQVELPDYLKMEKISCTMRTLMTAAAKPNIIWHTKMSADRLHLTAIT